MKVQHTNLAAGRWNDMPFCEQMANIGSEVERAISWRNKGNKDYSQKALYRALELLTLTKKSQREFSRIKEVSRVYEVLVDHFKGDNLYKTSEDSLKDYFNYFSYLTAEKRGL